MRSLRSRCCVWHELLKCYCIDINMRLFLFLPTSIFSITTFPVLSIISIFNFPTMSGKFFGNKEVLEIINLEYFSNEIKGKTIRKREHICWGKMKKTIFCLFNFFFSYMEWLFSVFYSLVVGWLSVRMEITFREVLEWEKICRLIDKLRKKITPREGSAMWIEKAKLNNLRNEIEVTWWCKILKVQRRVTAFM